MTYQQYRNYIDYVMEEFDSLTEEEKAEKIKAVALARKLTNQAIKDAISGTTLDLMTPAKEDTK